MKTRIVAGVILASLLFLVVLVLPKSLAAVIMGILQAIASYELLYRTRLVTKPRLIIYSCGMAFLIAIWSYYEAIHAYFVGVKFGKHKLAPVVSPNKTIEGALGGIASGVVAMLLYTFILDVPLKFDVNYGAAILYGILGCLVGEMGDLCFSVIKRQTGIKDYGNLIPGHGGVLDRFDSILAVAPLIEAMLLIMPVIVL